MALQLKPHPLSFTYRNGSSYRDLEIAVYLLAGGWLVFGGTGGPVGGLSVSGGGGGGGSVFGGGVPER